MCNIRYIRLRIVYDISRSNLEDYAHATSIEIVKLVELNAMGQWEWRYVSLNYIYNEI